MKYTVDEENFLRAKVSTLESRIFTLLEKATEDPTRMILPHEALLMLRDAVVARRDALKMLSEASMERHKEQKAWIEERYGDKPYH